MEMNSSLNFRLRGLLLVELGVLHVLLGDGRATLRLTALGHVDHGAGDAHGVDAACPSSKVLFSAEITAFCIALGICVDGRRSAG